MVATLKGPGWRGGTTEYSPGSYAWPPCGGLLSLHCKNGSVYDTYTTGVHIGTSECVLHTIFVSMCTPHVCHAHLSFYSV